MIRNTDNITRKVESEGAEDCH